MPGCVQIIKEERSGMQEKLTLGMATFRAVLVPGLPSYHCIRWQGAPHTLSLEASDRKPFQ